jgi:hypothetical protein
MAKLKQALVYGFLAWLVPFSVSLLIFPLKRSWPALFESLMPVVVAAVVMALACARFRTALPAHGEGLRLGLLWLAISWGLDLPLFLSGPMKMTFTSYAADIGLVYAMMPVITVGAARLRSQRT